MTLTAELAEVKCNSLKPGCVLDVETKTRHYQMEYVGDDRFRISGHPEFCPEPILAKIHGSIDRLGEFQPGVIGSGMRLMFRGIGDHVIATSEVTAIHMDRGADGN
jgi:hypothetical protein